MITFPNCKINLGLRILEKRNDGYHNLETVFYPIPLTDVLEILPQKEAGSTYSQSGLLIAGDPEDNLCRKAYCLLKKDFPQIPDIQMHLHKVIPTGAGLGGGSSDGAFGLHLLNKKFNLGLSKDQLLNYAAMLGSDCPFFIINKPCHATGRGELLKPITLNLSRYKFYIVHPGISISTAWAFTHIQPLPFETSILSFIHQPIANWKHLLTNDFENPVFFRYPEIKKIKEDLYQAGAIYASLSGSGAAVFGIFEKEKNVTLSFPAHYFVKEL